MLTDIQKENIRKAIVLLKAKKASELAQASLACEGQCCSAGWMIAMVEPNFNINVGKTEYSKQDKNLVLAETLTDHYGLSYDSIWRANDLPERPYQGRNAVVKLLKKCLKE